jgi:hypothetical protein
MLCRGLPQIYPELFQLVPNRRSIEHQTAVANLGRGVALAGQLGVKSFVPHQRDRTRSQGANLIRRAAKQYGKGQDVADVVDGEAHGSHELACPNVFSCRLVEEGIDEENKCVAQTANVVIVIVRLLLQASAE